MLLNLRNMTLVISAIWLVGCTKYIEVPVAPSIPDVLIEDCRIVKPLPLDKFLERLRHFQDSGVSDPWEAAFLVQSEQWVLQTSEFGLCNLKLDSIRTWQRLQ